MLDSTLLKEGTDLLATGNKKEGIKILLPLYQNTQSAIIKLHTADALLSSLDKLSYGDQLIAICEEAITISQKTQQTGLVAHFLANKADLLMPKLAFLYHEQKSLKLSPDWIAFSTEADKTRHETLTAKIHEYEQQVESSLNEAVDLAIKSNDKQTLAHVLLAKGNIYSAKHMYYKMDCLGNSSKSKLWLKIELMRHPLLESLIIFNKKQVPQLHKLARICVDSLQKSAKVFQEISDSGEASAYYNLANHFKGTYLFGRAEKYLALAEETAKKYNDQVILNKIPEMRQAIANRNRDIPDYLAGETRANKTTK